MVRWTCPIVNSTSPGLRADTILLCYIVTVQKVTLLYNIFRYQFICSPFRKYPAERAFWAFNTVCNDETMRQITKMQMFLSWYQSWHTSVIVVLFIYINFLVTFIKYLLFFMFLYTRDRTELSLKLEKCIKDEYEGIKW